MAASGQLSGRLWAVSRGRRQPGGLALTAAHPEPVPAAYPHAAFYRFNDGHLRELTVVMETFAPTF